MPKLTIKQVEALEVEIDGRPIGTFKKDSEWNGLTHLKGKDGASIIITTPSWSWAEMFGYPKDPKTVTAVAVSDDVNKIIENKD